MRSPELCAPAGSLEGVMAACDHGADAVYVGLGQHNLRAHCANFTPQEFGPVLEYVKSQNRKLYCALNAMPDDRALEEIGRIIRSCGDLHCIPDAFIVSDPGVLSLCRRSLKNVPLHLSTQTGTFNSESAKFWKQQGVARIILPRELSLTQIASLIGNVSMETEMFVHGAMCVSISGRCLLGAYLSKRHANLGDCPQPCRLKYRIAPFVEERANDTTWFTVEEDFGPSNGGGGSFLLNSKDLNTLSILPQIIATGVSSLKIEGRNKSPHYVASVVKVYREAIDACVGKPDSYFVGRDWDEELERLDHRPYTTGFYGGEYELQAVAHSRIQSGLRIVGFVKALLMDGRAVVDVKNPFAAGDTFNILPVKTGVLPYEIRVASMTDMNGNSIERALTNRVVLISATADLRIGDMLRKTDSSISLIHP